MGKKLSKAGAELRRAIRAEIDANPGIDHAVLRGKHRVGEPVVAAALGKTTAEWDAVIAAMPDPAPEADAGRVDGAPATAGAPAAMPGIEQGIVKFTRKPAKMGDDHIFWIPRVYVKNGLVDPSCEYEVYLKKRT